MMDSRASAALATLAYWRGRMHDEHWSAGQRPIWGMKEMTDLMYDHIGSALRLIDNKSLVSVGPPRGIDTQYRREDVLRWIDGEINRLAQEYTVPDPPVPPSKDL